MQLIFVFALKKHLAPPFGIGSWCVVVTGSVHRTMVATAGRAVHELHATFVITYRHLSSTTTRLQGRSHVQACSALHQGLLLAIWYLPS